MSVTGLHSVQDRLFSVLEPLATYLKPYAEWLEPYAAATWQEASERCRPVWKQAQPHVHRVLQHLDSYFHVAFVHADELTTVVDRHLRVFQPWQLVLASFLAALILSRLWNYLRFALRRVRQKGIVQLVINFLKALPIVRTLVRRELDKIKDTLRKDVRDKMGENGGELLTELPEESCSAEKVLARMGQKGQCDVRIDEGHSRVSGAVYLAGPQHLACLQDAYAAFAHTNPLHPDVFPSVRRMEAEVVTMTAAMLGGGPKGRPDVCGAMTSGGSESILSAVKASRDFMRAERGITEPEMIIGESAHAAFFKAAEYFNIKLVKVPVGPDFRLTGRAVQRALTRNTVLVVASSPCFPHGVVDHVEDIAKVTRRAGVLLHSDACLGGFVLPFARRLGHPVPAFDFSVPGVTSMSVDTHKFGMAHKGTSVVLYHSPALRKYQYTSITEWTGGLYISPGFAGSRSGALIATAWASMVHQGLEGYLRLTRQVMQASQRFCAGLAKLPELALVGRPDMCVVAFRSARRGLDIYALNDLLSRRGWHLNALQGPPALHMCFTAQHSDTVADKLLEDLAECIAQLVADPSSAKGGSAPLYGMAAVSPDRTLIGDFLVAYQDVLLEL